MSTIVVEPEPGRLSPQTTLATRSSLHGPMSTDSRGGVMSMSDYRIPTDNPGVPKFRARIGDGQRRDREIGQIVPATPRRDRPRPIGERDAPKPFKILLPSNTIHWGLKSDLHGWSAVRSQLYGFQPTGLAL